VRRAGPAVNRQDEQGCRAGRKPPIEQRLAAKDEARHQLRAEGMKGVGNWPTGKEK
jgi:hypothetical protein